MRFPLRSICLQGELLMRILSPDEVRFIYTGSFHSGNIFVRVRNPGMNKEDFL